MTGERLGSAGLCPHITLEPVCGVTFKLTGTRRKPVQTGTKARASSWEHGVSTSCVLSAFTGSDRNPFTHAKLSTCEALPSTLLSRRCGVPGSTSERRLFELHFLDASALPRLSLAAVGGRQNRWIFTALMVFWLMFYIFCVCVSAQS